ncbi:hypothetical protein VKT23_010416 [Stygiomarasmius scandens]|uniref:F-box domain-containing protein n=1 Tax=Marasmiellus scandens TaxID=2682957 RepID=A0ABR1JGT6_9AGAR
MPCNWQRTQHFQPRVTQFDVGSLMSHMTSDVEQGLRDAISTAKEDIVDYEKDIDDLERLVLSIKEKRDQLKQYTRDCERHLSPLVLERLPSEVLGEIFLHYQDMQSSRKDGQFREPIGEPYDSPFECGRDLTTLTLASVCSRWRDVCFATPQLWSRFSIALVPDCTVQLVHNSLSLYLTRSKQVPLFMDIFINDDPDDTADGARRVRNHVPNLQLLLNNCHRWRSTSWKITCPNPQTAALLSVSQNLPLLKHLQIEGTLGNAGPITLFTGVRALTTLNLRLPEAMDLDIPLGSVLHVRMFEVDSPNHGLPSALRQLLQRCPKLISLDLDVVNYRNIAPGGPITHRSLASLLLEVSTRQELYTIVSMLTVPALKELSIGDEEDPFDSPINDTTIKTAFSLFISRSQCSITTLKFTHLHSSAGLDNVKAILPHVPTVTDLTLSENNLDELSRNYLPHIMRDLIHMLYVPAAGGPGVVLPNLQRLRIKVDWYRDNFDHELFTDIVHSRSTLNVFPSGQRVECLNSVILVLNCSTNLIIGVQIAKTLIRQVMLSKLAPNHGVSEFDVLVECYN